MAAIVVDASPVVALISKNPRGDAVAAWLSVADRGGDELRAPALIVYELESALTRLVKASRMSHDELRAAWEIWEDLPVRLHNATGGVHVVEIALSLDRTSAYDAAYLALARELDAEVWTLDVPLMRNATGLGYRVRVIDQPPTVPVLPH